MALALSSSITSSSSFTFGLPIASKRHFLSTHLAFRVNHAGSNVTGHFRIQCKSSKSDSKVLAYRQNIAANLCTSIFESGTKKFESLIALILIFVQISSPLPLGGLDFWSISPAEAVLYSPDTKVPRTGELALRRAIPANSNMKAMQNTLEDISFLLRIPQRKPYGTMEGNVKKALKIAVDEKDSILGSIPADLREKGSTLYATLIDGKVWEATLEDY